MKRRYKQACRTQLTQRFGMTSYRPGQKAALGALLSGRDVLCLLPTGAGKSLCWQIPALVRPGMTVVVSPLIALMRDQVLHLEKIGVPALSIDSLMSPDDRRAAMEKLRKGEARIVFVSPERLQTAAFRQLCRDVPPWLLVIDEAHCVVQWGADFRPAYGSIGAFAASLPVRPVLCAMTATADCAMQRQLIGLLGLRRPRRVTIPVIRENLRYQVRTAVDPIRDIGHILAEMPGKAIIYCRTRARTEYTAERLRAAGCAAQHYHAGLSREERDRVQRCFISGDVRVLTATTAFGMGVDIPDVRLVVHDHLPDSVIDYVQQSGRAGRDGVEADCILFIGPADLLRISSHVSGAAQRLKYRPFRRYASLRKEWRPVRELLRVCLTANCIQQGIAATFGQRVPPCGICSACRVGPLQSEVPHLPSMQPWQTRAWLLRWQRDAIARKHGVTPSEVLPEKEVRRTARTLSLPEKAPAAALAMMPLLRSFRRYEAYAGERDGTYYGLSEERK